MMINFAPSDLVESVKYDEMTDKMIRCTTYDNSEVIRDNIEAQKNAPERGRYKKTLTKVGSIHLGDLERLRLMGYNLLSPDPEERRRALCYIQTDEPHLMAIPGKPFARKRERWV